MGQLWSEEAELGALMERRAPDILRRWLARVESELTPQGEGGVDRAELRDAMPDYLHRLAETLRTGTASAQSGSTAWSEVAKEHAVTRVRLGFDIGQLMHEFVVLRNVVFEVAAEEHGSITGAQAARLVDLLEAGMTVAVKTYVQARDYAAREREAEHVGFLSHELRNPLSAAKLATERLKASGLAHAQAKMLATIERNVDRLLTLLGRALQMGRLASGKVEAHVQTLSLGALLEHPLATARAAAAAKGVALETRVDDALLVSADPDLSQMAFANVLDNAVKYTDKGTIEVSSEETPERIVVRVHDNCCGLSNAELRVIFEPFERGRTHKPGSGLGLAITRRALEAQGASVAAESPADGRGCEFSIALPRARH